MINDWKKIEEQIKKDGKPLVKFKGYVNNESNLPNNPTNGDLYIVREGNYEILYNEKNGWTKFENKVR